MLKMAQKQYIKHLYEVEEKSLLEIAKTTGFNYRTVQKYAYQEDWSDNNLPNIEPQNYPILGNFIPIIDKWLEADCKIPRKQRHTAKRVYDRLREEEGFGGSYSSVKKYVRKKKYIMKVDSEGYLPLAQPSGHGQVDFGEFLYRDDTEKERTGYALTISFPQSNKGYTQAFPSQNQECLLAGMQRIFERIGGVPLKLRFDNMSTAVAQVLKGNDRILTDGFTRFMLHYRFQADFCNPGSGNEKGNVENKVGYSRRNAFVPVPTISSFEDFNEYLWDWCEKDADRNHYKHGVSIKELWGNDRDNLLRLPEYSFPIFRYEVVTVNKYGFAIVDTNKYGLSPTLSKETVQAKIFFDHIEFFHDRQLVGSFIRSYAKHEEIYDWTQYVPSLCRKPGATLDTRFFQLMPKLWQQHLKQSQGKERKNALQLLNEIICDGNASLCDDALVLASENGRTDVDSIRQCYYMIARKEHRPEPLKLLSATPRIDYNPNLSDYDSLAGGVIHG